METLELLELIQKGESSRVQFKEGIKDAHSISQEMVAFANLKGGVIIIGVNDKTGEINGLSFSEIHKHNEMLSNAASNNIIPELFIETEQISVDNKVVSIIYIKEGNSKPYKDKNGIIWIKNGSDKRRVTSNEELARLLQDSKNNFADEQLIHNTTFSDFDITKFEMYLKKRHNKELKDFEIDVKQLAQNSNLFKDNCLTLTGLLLFGKNPQQYRPLFSIQCVSILDETNYEDKELPFDGDLKTVFDKAIAFITRNLRKIQSGKSFNSLPIPEIPYEIFEELIVNALIHRNYFINSTVKIFIYPDRIEIISPGVLPNSLTIENILNGISIPRNPTLQSIAQFLLPYSGLGSGIMRIKKLFPEIELINHQSKEQFIAIIKKQPQQ